MGRCKVDIKKIENVTRCQVTFSKRRNGLIKKAYELSVLCDVDVVFIVFSPSGRFYQFPNKTRLVDVLIRYVKLPDNQRNYHIENHECLLELLEHIKRDSAEENFDDDKIKRLKQQIINSRLELQKSKAKLTTVEPGSEQELQVSSVAEVEWREKFVEELLKRVMDRRDQLSRSRSSLQRSNAQMGMDQRSLFDNSIGEQNQRRQFHISNQILMQVDPWLQNYRFQRDQFHDQLSKALGLPTNHRVQEMENPYPISNPPVSNLQSWNQMGNTSQLMVPHGPPPYQPFQQGMVNNGYTSMLQNQNLGTMGTVSTGTMGQQLPRGTFSNYGGSNSLISNYVPLMFNNNEEMNWVPNAPLNYYVSQPSNAALHYGHNLNVSSQPSNPSRFSSSSVYDPKYEGMGLHVDPFLREYDLSNNSNSNSNSTRPNNSASNPPIQNHEDTSNEEGTSSEQPVSQSEDPNPDPILPDDPFLEDVIGEYMQWTPGNQEDASVDDDSILPEFLLNLDDHEKSNALGF